MTRRSAPRCAPLALAAALAASCAAPRAGRAPPADEEAIAIADEYAAAFFARHPETATLLAYPGADHAAVTDNRPEALRAWHTRQDALLARARAVRGLVPGSAPSIAHALVLEALEASVAMRACRTELWAVAAVGAFPEVHSAGGWQDTYANLAGVQPVGTPELRRAAVARLARVPALVDQEIENLRDGMRLGFTASRGNVERTLGSLDAMLASPPGEWPYLDPARRDPDPGLRDALEHVISETLLPATRRYRDFLAREYLPVARAQPGVASLPGGAACYRAAIRAGTTTTETPERLHALGLEELSRIRAEMRVLAERSFGTSDVTALLEKLAASPENRFASADEIVRRAAWAVSRAQTAVPRAFSRTPRCRPEVRPFPDAIASAGAPPMSTGSWSGNCYAGVYFINTWDPTHRAKLGDVSTAFHETLPGHHLEAALKLEARTGPAAARHFVNNAYAEGWAVYAERLADELGLLETDFDRLGMLKQQAFRAARLVADTGLHAFGWTREQAAATLASATGGKPEDDLAEVDRYCAWPGQALGYMAGALELRNARAEAERALGARFDLVRFHDVVLEAQLPLPVLRERVRTWIASGGGAAGAP